MANTNNNNNNPPPPGWDYEQSFGPHAFMRAGAGVDHASTGASFGHGFPFNNAQTWPGQEWARSSGPWNGWHWGPGWHGGGHDEHNFGNYREVPTSDREEGDHDHDHKDDDGMESSPETMRNTPDESVNSDAPHPPTPGAFPHPRPPPPAGAPQHPPHPAHPPHPPHPFFHGHPRPFGGPHRGRGGRFGRRGGRGGPPPPPPSYSGPWDFRPLMHAFATHPFAEAFKDYMEQAREGLSHESNEQQDNAFVPPVDVFNTEKAYILHVSLPGAKKEDVGVNWDGDKVNIAGVIYRPGDEAFISCLASSERKVGLFERSIKLPPPGSSEKEEIDGAGITAKMENGILIVTVPKTERDWTQIHKVDIE
ncbi:HSP20-like chaperone [Annulohypoxylon maeteangense]|uniref:HSP20-like chaperone n=1 Tax=Annulohypoxylon maeteangense TaxID=1927788 RepID=UPI002008AEA1|nr:HSP20-like chaperone [Annulohypoxylon maeteangense]KAI0890559.1 HSP20-like chaperone [Annulohypoxylon maeteangense]